MPIVFYKKSAIIELPDEEYSIEAIRNAYQHGCTFFDTAEVYSPNLSGIGHNELIVGKALEDVRENVVIATKLLLHSVGFGRKVYDEIRRHLEGSLDRLRTDYVDIYYLHRMGGVPVEKVAEAMGRLIDDGLIRGLGVITGRCRCDRPCAEYNSSDSDTEYLLNGGA